MILIKRIESMENVKEAPPENVLKCDECDYTAKKEITLNK
jgi:hypothetical protein